MSDLSYLDQSTEALPMTAMEEVMAVIGQLNAARDNVAELEERLGRAKEEERKLSEEVVPQLLDNHGVDSLRLVNGLTVEVKEDVKASIPKDVARKERALEWLRAQGAESLIKDYTTVENAPDELLSSLDKEGIGYDRELNVNAASLAAWFREKFGIKKGAIASLDKEDVSPDISCYRYRKTVIK